MGSRTAVCYGCANPLLVSAGNAAVIDGRVQQVCDSCVRTPRDLWAAHSPPPLPRRAITVDDRPPASRPRTAPLAAIAAACLAFAPGSPGPAANPLPTMLAVEPVIDVTATTRVSIVPEERPRAHRLTMSLYGEDLTWYHPLAGQRAMPETASRRFGANRTGTRAECGAGHCGVDLGYERGPVIHAVAEGYVDRIVRATRDKGGRYVKIRHPDGFCSFYMHLDRIHPDLSVGTEISPGDPVGTMGRTGIQNSAPHLHFAVTLERGINARPRFVDPEPMLREAIVLPQPAPFPPRR